MTPAGEGARAAARRLADDVLFPDAMRVDRLDVLPTTHLDALAEQGLFGTQRTSPGSRYPVSGCRPSTRA